jgi:hypothetical protein
MSKYRVFEEEPLLIYLKLVIFASVVCFRMYIFNRIYTKGEFQPAYKIN